MPNLTFVVEMKCAECGDILEFTHGRDRYGNESNEIVEVEPCETCIDNATEKAKDEAEREWGAKVNEAFQRGVIDATE